MDSDFKQIRLSRSVSDDEFDLSVRIKAAFESLKIGLAVEFRQDFLPSNNPEYRKAYMERLKRVASALEPVAEIRWPPVEDSSGFRLRAAPRPT